MSVNRAYKQGRGDKKLSPLDRIKRIWAKATVKQRLAIARWVLRTQYQSSEEDNVL